MYLQIGRTGKVLRGRERASKASYFANAGRMAFWIDSEVRPKDSCGMQSLSVRIIPRFLESLLQWSSER